MKYLLTGGAGFIGSHLAEALLGRGDENGGVQRHIPWFREFSKYRSKPRTTVSRLPVLWRTGPWLWSRTTGRTVAADPLQGKKVVRDWGASLRTSPEYSPRSNRAGKGTRHFLAAELKRGSVVRGKETAIEFPQEAGDSLRRFSRLSRILESWKYA